MDDAHVEPEFVTQPFGVPGRLGEQVAGVEEDDFGIGDRLADEMNEDGVAEAGGDQQLVPEVVARPAQDVQWVGEFERGRHLLEVGEVDVGAHAHQSGTIPE